MPVYRSIEVESESDEDDDGDDLNYPTVARVGPEPIRSSRKR